jgi:copper resistance protein D
VDEALILVAFYTFAAGVLLFGIGIVQEVVAPTALARAITRPLRRLVAVAIVVVFLTTLVWLLLAAGEMGDGWSDSWNPNTLADVCSTRSLVGSGNGAWGLLSFSSVF